MSKGKIAAIVIIIIIAASAIYSFASKKSEVGQKGVGDESLLAACAPGKFTGKSERLTIDVEVLGPASGGGCEINASLAIPQFAGFGEPEKYDANKDGELSTECTVPTGTSNFNALTEFLQNNNTACAGEYMDYVEAMMKAFEGF